MSVLAFAPSAAAAERSGLRATTSRAPTPSTRPSSSFAPRRANRRRASSSSPRAADASGPQDSASASSSGGGGIPERNLRRDLSAQEYADLKAKLAKDTALYGAGLCAYSTLGYGLANGISAAWGAGASLLYLKLLGEYVDELEAKELTDDAYTRNLVYEPVTDVFGMLGGAFGKVGSVYSQALLQKRLLVPVLFTAAAAAFNAADFPFDVNYGPALLGFLTYKAAVLTKLYEDLKPDIVSAITGGRSEDE